MQSSEKRTLAALTDGEVAALDVKQARDVVVECFFDAQRETFSRAATKLGAAPDDAQLWATVQGAVRLAFRAVKADFNEPTRAGLVAAVEVLATKAAAMGTPPDIIERHKHQLGRLFAHLKDDGVGAS